MKRLLSLSLVSTPVAFVVLSLLSAQPAMADKRQNVTGTTTQWYWCAGTAASTFSSYYGIPIPSEVGTSAESGEARI